jgi:hypothetical protein
VAASTRRALRRRKAPCSLNATGVLGGLSTPGTQAPRPSPRGYAAAAPLRDRVHGVRSASFPTGGKELMTRFAQQ